MKTLIPLLLISLAVNARGEFKSVNPTVKKIVDSVSEAKMSETLKKLEGFGTRDIFSDQESATNGIGAARRWIGI